MNVVRVALDVPLPTLFDYRADEFTLAEVGQRVLVPFGKKTAVGVIIELALNSTVPPERLKGVLKVLREGPALTAADLELLRFASDYYHHPLGAVVVGSLRAGLRRTGNARP